jgi:hypothetical protein
MAKTPTKQMDSEPLINVAAIMIHSIGSIFCSSAPHEQEDVA